MELKFMQNSSTTIKMNGVTAKVITTMGSLYIYQCDILIGSSGVKNPKDFDYESLLAFAKHKAGSKIQVA